LPRLSLTALVALMTTEDIRLEREVALNAVRSDSEVVLLEASDQQALERTHRRYFATLDQLLSDFESSTSATVVRERKD
jgi:hypothetical protein